MGGLMMSRNRKFRVHLPRSIMVDDIFFPQEILSQHVNYSIPSSIKGSTCEVATKENECLGSVAERIRELFFTRTELISRALSGSYVITREEALDDLREQYDATKDPKLEVLLHFPWNSLPVRFRKVINRCRSKVPIFTQAEVVLQNETGIYFYYFNFISCDIRYPSFTRYSYVLAIEPSYKSGFLQAYFAVTCPSTGDPSVLIFTENIVKGISHWIHSQKIASVNVPLSCVPSSYYSILEEIRQHPVVLDLSNCWSDYERTNKAKHIYENIGIVAYLATYWLSNAIKEIHFVDIGCGNGVISYLLNSIYGNKMSGVGYDAKSRNIWEYYKSKARDVLKVQTISANFPSLEQSFPVETNYIIGIHTDEMTPWIPLMAMKRKCNFFLLPCCPFDFFGPFAKRNHHNGYNEWEYINHIVSLAKILGFDVKVDFLKITSEKKTAIIGTIPASGKLLCDYNLLWEDVINEIMEPSFKANNYKGCQPPGSVIKVINCTKLPVEVRNSINQSIVNILQSASDPKLNRGNVTLRNTVYETFRLPKTSNYPCFFEQFLPEKCRHRDVCGYNHDF
uniref:tRNA (uracil-O(2)-)-methyltransferase n=1 Tax=Panagrolaimus sp. ES5 TaxID=591445 RepID=A0AC34FNL1_9BILA